MNKKILWIIIILLIAIIIFTKMFSNNDKQEEFKPLDKNIGDEFNEISYPNKMYIVNYEIGDINGDATKDMVLLVGGSETPEAIGNSIINNMDVVLYNTADGTFVNAGTKKFNGENNKIIIADFTGDKVDDIMIISKNENNSIIRVYTYENSKLKEIWKDRNDRGLIFNGEFLDGFKVKVINKKLNFEQIIDLSGKKDDYISSGLYDNSGKLIGENKNINASGLIQIELIKLNDRTGIKAIQRIYGINNDDILEEINITWKYSDGKWQIVEANGFKLGNLLY